MAELILKELKRVENWILIQNIYNDKFLVFH